MKETTRKRTWRRSKGWTKIWQLR